MLGQMVVLFDPQALHIKIAHIDLCRRIAIIRQGFKNLQRRFIIALDDRHKARLKVVGIPIQGGKQRG